MLRVQVCATHMGGSLGPKLSKQGSSFREIFLTRGWVFQKLAKNSQNGMSCFLPKFIVYNGKCQSLEEGSFLNTGWPDPHPSSSHVPLELHHTC